MDSDSIITAIVGFISAYIIVIIVLGVLLIIANWKIFSKAGEGGWKSLIPVYSSYIQYKIAWNPLFFWISLGCSIVCGALGRSDSSTLVYLAGVFGLAASVLAIIRVFKLSKAFGHGTGFGFGLLFLPNIFTLILGFGKSQYLGPQE